MAWKKPGVPYEVEIDGQKLWLKPLTVKERKALAELVSEKKSTNDDKLDLDWFYTTIAGHVDRIDGIDGDIVGIFAVQSMTTVMEIYQALLTGSSLTEVEAKNLDSSLDTEQPTRESTSAEETASPAVASDSGQ